MFRESSTIIESLPGPVRDIDLTPSGSWIAVTEFGKNQWVSFGGKNVPIPFACRFPIIRAVNDDTALVVDARAGDQNNGWILNSSGEVTANFYAGDAILDVLTSDRFIVITYFDESACYSNGIEGNGVAVFDLSGEFLCGYAETFGTEAVDIYDCYAACWDDHGHVVFLPYTDFPLVYWNVPDRRQQIMILPGNVEGSNAVTVLNDEVFFYSPYDDQSGIYRWYVGSKTADRVGSYEKSVRGLAGGRFFAVDRGGYTILSPARHAMDK
jgi:hypothetical protein